MTEAVDLALAIVVDQVFACKVQSMRIGVRIDYQSWHSVASEASSKASGFGIADIQGTKRDAD